MIIEMTKLLNTLSSSLDYVENEIIKIARNHGKRVAVLTNLMAKEAGYPQDVLYALTQSAVLHDCALAEYLKDELSRGNKSCVKFLLSSLKSLTTNPILPGDIL